MSQEHLHASIYFDVVDHVTELDAVGTELINAQAMRNEALRFMADLLTEEPMRLALGAKWTLIVRDDSGPVLRLTIEN